MSHIITLLLTGTVPPPPTHPGPPPIPPCTECPVGCENGNEPEKGLVLSLSDFKAGFFDEPPFSIYHVFDVSYFRRKVFFDKSDLISYFLKP